tara:strand:+ start:9555 stop:10523 length:969 start_codon:yes stop_codon:yes gene_type:complete
MIKPILSLVVPCFNEEEVINDTFEKLNIYLGKLVQKKVIDKNSFILFIDDGSSDSTWSIIKKIVLEFKNVNAIKLSKNFGHQNALLAGLIYSQKKVDCAISIDADLQQDYSVIESMIQRYIEGVEIVYGVRNKRIGEKKSKQLLSNLYYKILMLIGVNLIANHADFRLHGKKSLAALLEFKEHELFLRGIFPYMGFTSEIIGFDQDKRHLGDSKYTFKKMFTLAISGVTSFSTAPLRMIFITGFVVLVISLIMSLKVLWSWYVGDVVPGWTELMLSIYFLGAIQLISIGFIGEYISKVHHEIIDRPRYIVDEMVRSPKSSGL